MIKLRAFSSLSYQRSLRSIVSLFLMIPSVVLLLPGISLPLRLVRSGFGSPDYLNIRVNHSYILLGTVGSFYLTIEMLVLGSGVPEHLTLLWLDSPELFSITHL